MAQKEHTAWVLYLIIRLVAVPLLFLLVYLIILNGRKDPMGYGLVYAFIATSWSCLLYFGIESVVLYRKKRKTKLVINLFLTAISALGALTVFIIL